MSGRYRKDNYYYYYYYYYYYTVIAGFNLPEPGPCL